MRLSKLLKGKMHIFIDSLCVFDTLVYHITAHVKNSKIEIVNFEHYLMHRFACLPC